MAQAEFEFWKIDSAFEHSAINACLQKGIKDELLTKLIRKATNSRYSTEKLKNTFEKFGWVGLRPSETSDLLFLSKKFLTVEETYNYCYKKALPVHGKNVKGILTKERLLAVVYFAQKEIELEKLVEQKKFDMKFSVFKDSKIDFLTIANLFFRKDRPQDQIHTSVLTVLTYSVCENFKSELEDIQSKVYGYSLGVGDTFSKRIDDYLLTFVKLSTKATVKANAGYYELKYQVTRKEADIFSYVSEKVMGRDISRRRWRQVVVTTVTPFKIIARYFGIKGELSEAIIEQTLVLIRTRMGLPPEGKKIDLGSSDEEISLAILKKIREAPELSLEEVAIALNLTKTELESYLELTEKTDITPKSQSAKQLFYLSQFLVLIKRNGTKSILTLILKKIKIKYGEAKSIVRELELILPKTAEFKQHTDVMETLRLLPFLLLLNKEKGISQFEAQKRFGLPQSVYEQQFATLKKLSETDPELMKIISDHEQQLTHKLGLNNRSDPILFYIKQNPELALEEIAVKCNISREETKNRLEHIKKVAFGDTKWNILAYCLLESMRKKSIPKLTTGIIAEKLNIAKEDSLMVVKTLKKIMSKNETVAKQIATFKS